MLTEKNLRPYQVHGVEHALDNPYAGLLLGLGLGKTVTSLTAVQQLMYDRFEVSKVLIIAPKRVAETVWHTEASNWEHLKDLKFSLVLGNERKRKEALQAKADIYVINRENVVWLLSQYGGGFPFDMLIIDELSSFKSHKSARWKALKMMRPRIKRVLGLTGTPRPNGLLDLWPQMYLLDMGERLGKNIGGFREKYFKPGRSNGHVVYNYNLIKEDNEVLGADINEREIYDKIGDICISMKTRDYVDMPPIIDLVPELLMPPDIRAMYDEFEKQQVMQIVSTLDERTPVISAASASVLSGKLLQFANGAIYEEDSEPGDNRPYHELHNVKMDALAETLEAANGDPLLIFYQFKHDIPRMLKHLKEYKPYVMSRNKSLQDVEDWNRGKHTAMIVHAASAGHGLNLQYGGHLMYWFGRPWALELYLQGVGRIERPGQKYPVINTTGAVKGTMDEKVIVSHLQKGAGQDTMMDAVKALIKKHAGLDVGALL